MGNEVQEYSKQSLGAHVGEALDIEQRIYTIETAVDEFHSKAKELRNSKKTYQEPRYASEKAKAKKHVMTEEEKKDAVREKIKSDDDYGSVIAAFFIGIGVLLLAGIGGSLVSVVLIGVFANMKNGTTILFVIMALIPTGFVVRRIIKNRKVIRNAIFWVERENSETIEYNREIEKNNQQVQADYDKALAEYRTSCAKAEKDYAVACAQATLFDAQAEELEDKLEQMYPMRDAFYSASIVPPDYRSLDCVCCFNQIFRNDLADTMREAVSIYEERVFRGEIVRGMHNIIASINRLGSSVDNLRQMVGNIQTNVSYMSQDLYRISDQLTGLARSNADLARSAAESARANAKYAREASEMNQKLLQQSEATRYATESIQKMQEYNASRH